MRQSDVSECENRPAKRGNTRVVPTFPQAIQSGGWTRFCSTFLTVLSSLFGSREIEETELATLLHCSRMNLAAAAAQGILSIGV